ncbi:hypothetical protein LIN78_15665 [Leeia sp. TBRC 13508]|uniref:Photosystem I assembly protein Ycf4 n=1 Tax=Leeia speluncae TaxID=2884804 RepID=A0ABS8D9Y5_9NEIS|nr:hypothetical protein [Leeia speluncae]MCB6184984.1 hypothetical protein [Leeia speluncae]
MVEYHPDNITIQNEQKKQFLIALIGCLVGYLLVHFAYYSGRPTEIGQWSALGLGGFILCISLYMAIANPKQTVKIDLKKRLIHVKTQSKFGMRNQFISFSDIREVDVGEIGDREGGSIIYYVDLTLKNGKHQKLFHGAYEGNTQYSTMHQYCKLIQSKLI